MGYSKPKQTTREYLESRPLPTHGKSYTVIPHARVIDTTLKMLDDSGFSVTKEIYRANMNANVAQGIYYITPLQTTDDKVSTETELGMMFAWTNSYDKSTRFQCSIGGYVMVCYNGTCSGDLMNFARKHTGSADADISTQISSQIKKAELIFRKIIDDRDFLRNTDMSLEAQAKMLGMLYCDLDILDNTQMSIVKNEMNKPSFDYNCNNETAWTFYNHVTHALKKAHPRTWLRDTQRFHDYITGLLKGTNISSEVSTTTTSTFNPVSKASELTIDDTDWLEVPSMVDVDIVQNRVENLLR